MVFYPTIPIHVEDAESEDEGKKIKRKKPSFAEPSLHDDPALHKHGRTMKCPLHKDKTSIRFRSIPNAIPTLSELELMEECIPVKDWEKQHAKQDYATSYDMAFKLHLVTVLKKELDQVRKDEMHRRKNPELYNKNQIAKREDAKKSRRTDSDVFIHLFGAPLYRLVSANFARLVVRRSFDLDLLEWRQKNCMDSTTIEEIKSRRVAITRHLRDINASIHVLGGLVTAEKDLDPKESSIPPEWYTSRPNGFQEDTEDKDSWWKIFWDFQELRATMETMQIRADKIQEGIIGMISIVNLENSNTSSQHSKSLSSGFLVFSVVLLPFTIVPPFFSDDGPKKTEAVGAFVKAVGITMATIFGLYLLMIWAFTLIGDDQKVRRKWLNSFLWVVTWLPKTLKEIGERDPENPPDLEAREERDWDDKDSENHDYTQWWSEISNQMNLLRQRIFSKRKSSKNSAV